ncbi:uncharacterized protein RHOBADRAFT_52235 [Rhodotorula graminis WP1]|uniref:Zn(2)-C6 fungal-type domain-containing protein n=1 Tax=Rhodotorula graminis (strain WP1) TaxID=578459 RepID=A0A194S6M1_RHOGW|nr:uncharacterized protein RHOBADRAFT_52235 [Rhodotorula graminis WP1]KPV76194.1 hypothetical protein RHOBADRAFT_52235 [Rhodotorula graminis WP1]
MSGFAPARPAPGPGRPVELPPFGEAPSRPASVNRAEPLPPHQPHQHQPAPPVYASTSTAPGPTPKRTTPACQRCRRGKVKCVTVDGALPCQVCVSRGHADSCVRGEKGKAADDRTPYVRKRPAAAADLDDLADSSFSGPQHSSRRTSYQGQGAVESVGARGSSLGGASGSGAAGGGAGGAGGGAFAGSPTPPSPTWSPQAVPLPLRAPVSVGAAVAAVKGEEGASEGGLPPLPVLVAGCESFFEGFFQLGFLHRPSFIHQLSTRPDTVSPFLLLAILSISARFVPVLVAQHGSPTRASEHYAARAHDLVLGELVSPSLAAVHALYLLAVHDFCHGTAFRAKVLQSVARDMADALDLHKDLPGASVIDNEIRRRTWHFLSLDANLVSASPPPPGSSFDPRTVPVPLPSHEQDFSFGVPSRFVQYLPGTTSAIAQVNQTGPGEASLLGALLAVGGIFGRTARALCDEGPWSAPWHEGSPFRTTQRALDAWLASLDGTRQKWSTPNLLAYRNLHLDLGFWHCYADFHAVHILGRRAHLAQMVRALAPSNEDDPAASAVDGEAPPEGRAYWAGMAAELVAHAFDVVELQEEVSRGRPATTGMTPHLSFCVYLAATILNYLRIYPWLCPSRVSCAPSRIVTALDLLQHASITWPVVKRWHRSLLAHATSLALVSSPKPRHESTSGPARSPAHLDVEPSRSLPHAGAGASASAAHAAAQDDAGPAGKMDAASALAAMSGAAGPPPVLVAGPVAELDTSSTAAASAAAARSSDAMSGLLRAAAAGAAAAATQDELDELGDDAPVAQQHGEGSVAVGGLYTPHSERGPSGSDEVDELLRVDFGDLDELRAFLGRHDVSEGRRTVAVAAGWTS